MILVPLNCPGLALSWQSGERKGFTEVNKHITGIVLQKGATSGKIKPSQLDVQRPVLKDTGGVELRWARSIMLECREKRPHRSQQTYN